MMRVLFFGTENRDYADVQMKGLRKNGIEVLECSAPVRGFADNITQGKPVKKTSNLLKWISFVVRTRLNYRRLKKMHKVLDYDIIFTNTSGFHNLPLICWIAKKRKCPLVYNAWISIYDSLLDRGVIKKGSLRANIIFNYENKYLHRADLVIVETFADKRWFCSTFNLPEEKVKVVYVGADDEIFYPKSTPTCKDLNVLFYATNIPLQGIPVVLKAKELLAGHPEIKFMLIGPFEGSDMNWVDYKKLPDFINRADVVLGIFGTTRGHKYIPNKVFQPIACAKPVISADTPAMCEAFKHGESACLIQPTAKALANAILEMRDKSLRDKIAEGGHKVYKERFAPEKIGAELKGKLSLLLDTQK